jgi:prevent-host-death family protein
MTKSVSARQVGVHEAKTRFSELLRAIDAGEEIEILRNGEPVARLVPAGERRLRSFGGDAGAFTVPDDFDSPLADEIVAAFEA